MTNLFHSLSGDNLYFKALSTNDAQEIHRFTSDEDVSRFIGWKLMISLDETIDHIERMIQREIDGIYLYASIALKVSSEIIGTAMVFNFNKEANHAEMGYVLHKNFWGRGYGRETVKLLIDFAFSTLKLHKIHANVVDTNWGSIKVLEHNGFELEGRLKDYYLVDGKFFDGLIFGKVNSHEKRL